MIGWGPLATWRQARRTCSPDCFGYHATWTLVRRVGLKASPRWHTEYYRAALSQLRPGDNETLRVLIAGAADHTAVATLAAVAAHPITMHVVDQCPTPLAAVDAWAADHGITATTEHTRIEHLDPGARRVDVVICDGLLSLLADHEAQTRVLSQLAATLAPTGVLIYTTRLTVGRRRLEYDTAGRLLQTAAAATWRQRTPGRLQVAIDRWHRPARLAPYTTVTQLHDDLRAHFATVTLAVDDRPATAALRYHPRNFLTGAASYLVRATAIKQAQ